MLAIYKYPLQFVDRQQLFTHRIVKPLDIQLQNETPYLWAVVDTSTNLFGQDIIMIGTGWEFDFLHEYIATVQEGQYVWHFFRNMR